MNDVRRLSGAAAGGCITSVGGGRLDAHPADPDPERVVHVNRHAARLLLQAGLTPPPAGRQYDPAELDQRLRHMPADARIAIKGHLRDAGLLPLGRSLDMRR